MTTPTSTANNKTALRASLKKEDESLAERLAATDVPLVPPAEAESSEIPVPAAGTVVAPARKTGLATATGTAKPAKAAVVKSAAAAKAAAPAPAAKSAKRAAPAKASLPAAAAKSKSSGKGATMVAKPGTSGKVARSPSRVESAPAVAKTESGKKGGKKDWQAGRGGGKAGKVCAREGRQARPSLGRVAEKRVGGHRRLARGVGESGGLGRQQVGHPACRRTSFRRTKGRTDEGIARQFGRCLGGQEERLIRQWPRR